MQVRHPMDRATALPTELRFAVKQLTTLKPWEVAQRRVDFFKFWNKRAMELETEEAALRATMDPLVSQAVAGKKLVLFKADLAVLQLP